MRLGLSNIISPFIYSLRQAIEDGYLVPYLLEQRVTNVDETGFTGPDGRVYTTANFEREIRMPDRTRVIADDLWQTLGRYGLQDEKTIAFCVDDTHAAFMAQEFRRLSGDPDYAARITRAERNSHQLERNFAIIGPSKPRLAVTVDLLTTGFDAPDVKKAHSYPDPAGALHRAIIAVGHAIYGQSTT